MPKMFRIFVVGLCFFAQVAASDPYVTCVQNQLTKLGYDPGPVDGASGPKTRNALAAFLDPLTAETRQERFDDLPKFSKTSAVGWCREIAMHDVQALPFMPSRIGSDVQFQNTVPPQLRPIVETSVLVTMAFFRDELGFTLASRNTVLVGTQMSALAKMRVAIPLGIRRSLSAQKRIYKTLCQSSKVSSKSDNAVSVTCLDPDVAFAPEQRAATISMVRQHVIGGYANNAIREMLFLSSDSQRKSDSSLRKTNGPAWLHRGTVDWIKAVVMYERFGGFAKSKEMPTLWASQRAIRRQGVTLSSIKTTSGPQTNEQTVAQLVAVILLTERYGRAALMRYWHAAGLTGSAEQAFQQEFGLTFAQFETVFDEFLIEASVGYEFARNVDVDEDGWIAGVFEVTDTIDE